MMLGLGLGLGYMQAPGTAAFDPTSLASFRSKYVGSALQTDTAGINNYTVFGSPTHGTQNGLTTEIFNGSTDRLGIATFSLGGSGGLSVFVAAKVISNDATRREIFEYSGITLAAHSGKGSIQDGSAVDGTTTIAGVWQRLGMTVDSGANQVLYVNGSSEASQVGVSAPPTSGDSQVANYLQFCNVEIGEILVFNAVLSSTDRGKVDTYLSTKWGI